ncbi:MAG: DUF7065 domain-containing protein [Solirubrobacteraceae bacterium]
MAIESDRDELTAEVEHPIVGETPGGWCENYAFVAGDPRAQISLIMCTGCQPFDTSLWHELLVVGLPGGRTLAWKSAGRGGAENGPGAAIGRWRCERPGSRWRYRFDGFGRLVSTAELAEGPLVDGPWVRAELELVFEAAGPVWNLSQDNLEHAWEHSHYEQLGRVTGTVTIDGEEWTFEGTGHRDHSRGPRDFASVLDHAWVDCLFGSGRFFALYRMRLPDGADGVAAACIGDSQSITPAKVIEMPLLDEEGASRERYRIVLETEEGRHTIEAEIVAPLGTTSYMTPNWMALGAGTAPEVTQIVFDGATRFTWDGEDGYGHTQRSVAPEHRR